MPRLPGIADQRQQRRHVAPVVRARELQVGDLHPHSGALTDANGLAYCVEHMVGLIADVRGIGGAVLAQDAGQGQQLLAPGIVARRGEQPGGHA